MVEYVAFPGAILAVVMANALLWVRARRLQRELSHVRVQRHVDWIINQAADGTAVPTPEERRRRFVVITGGLGGGVGTAVAAFAGRITASSWWTRSHPALVASTLTAAAALTALALVQINHIVANAPLTPAPLPAHSRISHGPGAWLRAPAPGSTDAVGAPGDSSAHPTGPEPPWSPAPSNLAIQDWPREADISTSSLPTSGTSAPPTGNASGPTTPPSATQPSGIAESAGNSPCGDLRLRPRLHVGICLSHSG